jgi:hypothetical protein
MLRKLSVALALTTITLLTACTDSTAPNTAGQIVQLATGSGGGGSSTGGGGGGGGGSGGGGSIRPCAILSLNIYNELQLPSLVPSFWQPNSGYVALVAGTAEKSCDTIGGASIVFEDITGAPDGCEVSISPWVNNPAYLNPKYGAKPMSRYQESFIYYTGSTCLGKQRTIRATLTDPSIGGKVSSVTLKWTP